MWGLFDEVDAGADYILVLTSVHATKEDAVAAVSSRKLQEDYYIVELKAGQTIWDIKEECELDY
jgi:hypothetical protein